MVDSAAVAEARRVLGQRLAAYRRAAGHTQATFASAVRYSRSTIANVETGRQQAPRDFWARSDDALACDGNLLRDYDEYAEMRREQHRERAHRSVLDHIVDSRVLERPARRRQVLDMAGGAAVAALGHVTVSRLEDLATALTTEQHQPRQADETDLRALAGPVARLKRSYQACRYGDVANGLPALLHATGSASRHAGGDASRTAYALAAEAYQLAGSLLLKLDDASLALLAADRSMDAARRSGDPIAVAASARIFTHALMASGHPYRAAEFARSMAERLDRAASTPSPEGLAVYGALLLRGAIATARCEDRPATRQLLDEAAVTASRLGADGNIRWTAFGPTNVVLHRINVSVALGDAGKAIDYARQVPLGRIPVAERRASMYIDVARAYAQWGKHDRAYRALRAAEETAPEELRARRPVHRLVAELTRGAPSALQPGFRDLADRIGAVW